MGAQTGGILFILNSSIITATAAVGFSQASSNKIAQIAWGILMVVAASFSAACLFGTIESFKESHDPKHNYITLSSDDLNDRVTIDLSLGAAITVFSLSILTVAHVVWRTLDSLKK